MRYTPEQIARICHDANAALQYVHGDPSPSQPWDAESAEVQDSAVAGVLAALNGATPRELHEHWCSYRRAAGWTPGPVKDSEKRTHPCLVPYEQLPREQRDKDTLFLAVVTTLATQS